MDSIERIAEQFEELAKRGYNVVGTTPTLLGEITIGLIPIIKTLKINPDPKAGEVHSVTGGKLSLTAAAYGKFQELGGISFDRTEVFPIMQDGKQAGVRALAIGRRFSSDGTVRTEQDEKTLLFDERIEKTRLSKERSALAWDKEKKTSRTAEQRAAWVDQQTSEYALQLKAFANESATTGAKNRVIRKLMGLLSSYTVEELQNPFVFLSYVHKIDRNDPEVKRMTAAVMLGIPQAYMAAMAIPQYSPSMNVTPGQQALPGGALQIGMDTAEGEDEVLEAEIGNRAPAQTGTTVAASIPFEDLPRVIQVERLRKLLAEKGEGGIDLATLPGKELAALWKKHGSQKAA